MKNWTIGKRITAGFAVVLILFAAVAATSFTLLERVKANQQEVVNDVLPGLEISSDIKAATYEIQLLVARHMLAKTPEEKNNFGDQIDALKTKNLEMLAAAEKWAVNPDDKAQVERIKAAREAYIQARGPVLELSRAGKMDEAMELNKSSLRPAFAEFAKACDDLFDQNSKQGTAVGAASEKTIIKTVFLTTTLSVSAIGLGAIIAFMLIKGLNRVLNNLARMLADGSNQVASAAGQVSSSSQSLAEGSSEQAASLEETSAKIEGAINNKITQSNAASAEESAAAAQELNGQAASMEQSVNELLQLVGGTGQEAASRPMVASAAPVRPKATVNHRSTGNGHALVAPRATNGNGRHAEIPMDGDFKDF